MVEEINFERLNLDDHYSDDLVEDSHEQERDCSRILSQVAEEIEELISTASSAGELFVTHVYYICGVDDAKKIMDDVCEEFKRQAPNMACVFLSIGHGKDNSAKCLVGCFVPEELKSLGLDESEWESYITTHMNGGDLRDTCCVSCEVKIFAKEFATNKLNIVI